LILFYMLELEEAMARIFTLTPNAKNETVSLLSAYNRVLTQSVCAKVDLPGFDNSAMDGYAVRASDVGQASAERPIRLRVVARIAAGENSTGTVEEGVCVRVFTGSLLPQGADAVVMQEDTQPDPSTDILVTESVRPWENVRFRGEDVKQGAVLAERGTILRVGLVSLLGAVGVGEVEVGCQPRVAVLATGTELREAGESLAPGQIYESNRTGLAVLLRELGACPSILPLVADTRAGVRAALECGFENADVVVSSGGVSVGEMDFIKSALEDLGGDVQFWRVAVKPGKPFVFGRYGNKLFFGLPGNPVSSLVTFLMLVRPALLRWQGAKDVSLPSYTAVLGERLLNSGQRRHFMRVKVNENGVVYSAGNQGSHVLSSLAAANGLVDVPPGAILETGAKVQVLRWDR
jgi:molybdopterin molybdotransferase